MDLKNYFSLIAGIVDEDDVEKVRKESLKSVLSERQEEIKASLNESAAESMENRIKDLVDEEKPELDEEKKEEGDEEECHCDGNHGMPEGWEVDETNPIVQKMKREKDPHTRPLTHVAKWASNTIAIESKSFVDKNTINEAWCEIADEVSVKLPPEAVLELAKIPSPDFSTTIVISLGAEGVPLLYIKKCMKELEAIGALKPLEMLSGLFKFEEEIEPVLGDDTIVSDEELDMEVAVEGCGCDAEPACECGGSCSACTEKEIEV